MGRVNHSNLTSAFFGRFVGFKHRSSVDSRRPKRRNLTLEVLNQRRCFLRFHFVHLKNNASFFGAMFSINELESFDILWIRPKNCEQKVRDFPSRVTTYQPQSKLRGGCNDGAWGSPHRISAARRSVYSV